MKADIIWLGSVDSTNEEAKRRLSGIDNLSVLSAFEQKAGRGQQGNRWSSNPGENLTFSIILKFSGTASDSVTALPKLMARDQFVLNEIASLSVVEFLAGYGITARIKWPNDIYVEDRKICGILVENSIRGDQISSSIIGIGLNINQKHFDVTLPNPTSMALCHPHSICHPEHSEGSFPLHHLLEEFTDIFISYHDRYLSAGNDTSALRRHYLERLWRKDQLSRFIDYTTEATGHNDGPMNIYRDSANNDKIPNEFRGMIRGLSGTGHLLVENLATGTIRVFGFKEIGYIL